MAIAQTLDPGAVEIWKTYGILADIAEKEADEASDGGHKAEMEAQTREYRRLARDARRIFAGTRHDLRQYGGLIVRTCLVTTGEEDRQEFEEQLGEIWWSPHLVAAIRSLLAGERNADVLCERLDLEDSMIVEAILRGIEDPETLKDLLPEEEGE